MVKAARAFAPVPADAAVNSLRTQGLVSIVHSTHQASKLSSLSKTTFFWSLNSKICLILGGAPGWGAKVELVCANGTEGTGECSP